MTCKHCGIKLSPPRKFYCSRPCMYAATNAAKVRKRWEGHKTSGEWNGRYCNGCGAKHIRRDGEPSDRWKRRKYCSKGCELASKKDADGFSCHAGYRVISHPNCCSLHSGMRYVREHIAKAEHVLGRKLIKNGDPKKWEVVHHINGSKKDNRNTNLLICTNEYHRWLHNRMSLLYQQQHFS